MRRFAALLAALDAAATSDAKSAALVEYFRQATAADAAWAAALLLRRAPARQVKPGEFREAAKAASNVPEWLLVASHATVKDMAETVALLVPPPSSIDERPLAAWIEEEIAPLGALPPIERRQRLVDAWDRLPRDARWVYNKLVTGTFRAPSIRPLVVRALATVAGAAASRVAALLSEEWTPSERFWSMLQSAVSARQSNHPPDSGSALDDGPPKPAAEASPKPHHIRAVLLYAQPGPGRGASLLTAYTFALFDGDEPVPVAKAETTLPDAQTRSVDRWIRRHTVERFGPVRRVEPTLVFELVLRDIRLSKRHRSGLSVRDAQLVRWCEGSPPSEADTLDALRRLAREAEG